MRTVPKIKTAEDEAREQEQVDKITRIVALVLAGCSTFFFFIKLLFL